MYSTCLYCKRDLGSNEALDDFPVGRRIAFDAAKGRLWVVCRGCERWNLSPLEERWEAVEQAERLYHDTRRRVATEHIGLARLRDGTELVRIGEPLRPEFAAWRYGDQFGRRRKRQVLVAGAGLAALGGVAIGGMVAGAAVGGFAYGISQIGAAMVHGRAETVVARIRTETAGEVHVRRRHLAETRIVRGTDAPIALDLRFKGGAAHFEGREALRIAGTLMPHVNRFGGKRDVVESAVDVLDTSGGAEGYFERLARYAPADTETPPSRKGDGIRKTKRGASGAFRSGLFGLRAPDKLALEMALHEEVELRAMQGELAELELAWRDAEEIAAIADNLFVPAGVRAALERLRGV
ncbi:MAG: hypothetical protein GEU90_04660 [Gemmatimonas sp.]|nr:hypothetical protein [Gemmatimonas sp.]